MLVFDSWSDSQLLAAARRGQAEAFGVFYERHCEAVKGYVRRRCGSANDAADLTAEVFASALLSVHRGSAERVVEGAPWLIGIARHKLIDSYRAGAAQVSALEALGLHRPPVSAAERSQFEDGSSGLRRALEELSPHEREALVERVVLERSYGEMAQARGESEPAVRKRVSRALVRVRSSLGVKT